MTWDWGYAWEITPALLTGLRTSLLATGLGFALAAVLGLAWALVRTQGPAPIRAAATAVAYAIRGTPLLVQLYVLFYVLPPYGLVLSPLTTGILGLGIHFAAYLTEVYRAGIESVPTGQWEAARALNHPATFTWTRIVLPQAIPAVLPGLANHLLAMFKDSAVLSVITVTEMLFVAREVGGQTFRYLEPITLTGLFFLALSYPMSLAVRALHARVAVTR